jgi:hypothetical protein
LHLAVGEAGGGKCADPAVPEQRLGIGVMLILRGNCRV